MYAGEWIAISDKRLITHGKELKRVFEDAKLISKHPFFIQVPDGEKERKL